MSKIYNVLFSIVLVFTFVVLSSSHVSAIEANPFANQDNVNKEITDDMDDFIKEDFNGMYGSIEVSKSFLWIPTEKLAEYSLTDNSRLCIVDCFATGKAVLYSEGKLFDSFDAKDRFGNLANINDLKIYIDVEESVEVKVPVTYKEECKPEISYKNGSKSVAYCYQTPDTYRTELINNTVKKEYHSEVLPAGNYVWHITGKKNKEQSVDWAVGIRGISTDEIRETWANWTTADCAGTGGDSIYIDGDYCVHIFNSSGTFGLLRNITNASILTVAGGGGGGSNQGGGGGGGGLIYNQSINITSNQTVTIGLGGAGAPSSGNQGQPGGNSTFGTISGLAIGGGGGKDRNSGTGHSFGGSGGGGAFNNAAAGLGKAGQGNDGSGLTGTFGNGAGGGAGTAGVANGSSNNGGRGGAGLNYTINGTNAFYAAGGGGGAGGGGCGGAGGSGIGGKGSADSGDGTCGASSAIAFNGAPATGSGGGGAVPGAGGNGSSGIAIVRYAAGGVSSVTINLNTPINVYNVSSSNVTFNASIVSMQLIGNNITLFVWYSNGTEFTRNFSLVNPSTNSTIWNIFNFQDGSYLWNAYGCSNTSLTTTCTFASSNRSFNIDTTAGSSSFNSPQNGSYIYSVNASLIQFNLNFTGADSGLGVSSCWWNASWNSTPNFVSCNPTYQKLINLTDVFGFQTIYAYINDSVNNIFSNRTSFIINRFYNYNNNSYETDNFNVSLEVWNQTSVPSAERLNYNGTNHTGTTTSLGGGKYSMNYSFDLPLTDANTTKQFSLYWNDGQSMQTAGVYNQSLSKIIFGICNATNTLPYINFTFKDENTLSNINASTDLFTGSYYLGTGTVNESILYSNATANPVYSYCFTPAFKPLNLDVSYQYSATDYPQRTYISNYLLTNATTNQVLYLLSTADGIYVTFQTINNLGDVVQGITVRAEREFSGVPTTVAQGTTDASGSVTFWLNPNFPHTIYFSGGVCTDSQFTITPTQSTYTVTLQCQGATNYDPSELNGILFQKSPASGPLQTGVTQFNYSVSSVLSNVSIVAAKFELIYSNGTLIMQNASSVSFGEPFCSSTQCNLSMSYNVTDGQDLKARYYVDVGTGYIILEADAHWRAIKPSPQRNNNLRLALSDLKTLFSEWTSPTCSASVEDISQMNGYDCTIDELEFQNKIEYSRFVMIFLFLAIALAVLGKFTGYDGANPGAFIYLIGSFIIVGSVIGGRTGEGLFYYSNLTPFHFLNNYLLAFTMIMMMIGYWCMVSRRQT